VAGGRREDNGSGENGSPVWFKLEG
jgi:hypothetical protein